MLLMLIGTRALIAAGTPLMEQSGFWQNQVPCFTGSAAGGRPACGDLNIGGDLAE